MDFTQCSVYKTLPFLVKDNLNNVLKICNPKDFPEALQKWGYKVTVDFNNNEITYIINQHGIGAITGLKDLGVNFYKLHNYEILYIVYVHGPAAIPALKDAGANFLKLDKYDIRDIIKKLGADAISALQKAGVGSSYDYMHKESGNPLDQEEIFNHDLNKTLDIDYLYKLSNNTTSAFNCVGNLIYNSSKNYFSEQSTPVDDAYKYIQNVFYYEDQ